MKALKELLWKLQGRNPEDGLREGKLQMKSAMAAKVIRADGREEELGVLSRKSVTSAFVNYLVQSFLQSTTSPLDTFKQHDAGTGTGAESTGDTTLGTAWGGARVAGTNTTGGAANVFQSLATIPFTASKSITEHGVFSATAAGTLLDRHSFGVITVASGDSIQFTYSLTCSAGG